MGSFFLVQKAEINIQKYEIGYFANIRQAVSHALNMNNNEIMMQMSGNARRLFFFTSAVVFIETNIP